MRLNKTIRTTAVALIAVALVILISPMPASAMGFIPGESGVPIKLTLDVTSNDYNIIENDYTYFSFMPDKTDYYCFRFNDGLKFDKTTSNRKEKSLTFKDGEYCIFLEEFEEFRIGVNPYPNGVYGGTKPICTTINATARLRNDMTDGLFKERATPAQVGVKCRQHEARDIGSMEIGGWFIAELIAGQEYELRLYKGNKSLYPDDPDSMWGAHVYTADEEGKEIKVTTRWNNKAKVSDDEIVFTPPKSGKYYIRIFSLDGFYDYDLLISEVKLTVNGKITVADAPIKGSFVSSPSIAVVNRTSASIKAYIDLYDSDGQTVLSETGEPLASGHTFTETIASCKSKTIAGDFGALAEYMGYTIASDKKSVTFKYRRIDGLARRCEHIQRHEEEGSFCDGLYQDFYVNGTDADITGRVVLYEDSEHGGIVCDQGGYTYQYNIPAMSMVKILDDTGEFEKGTPEYELSKIIVFERQVYDEISHTVTDYYHILSGNLTQEQRQALHQFSIRGISDINDFKNELPAEIDFKYLDPQVSGIPYHRYDDVTSYLFTETPYIKHAGIKTSRYYSDGVLSIATQLRVKGLYLDEACAVSAVQREDSWVPNGAIYAMLGFETVATYDCGGALGKREIVLTETPDDEAIVVKVNLIRVLDPSADAVDQITNNKIKRKKISFGMTDLKGLNADVLSTSAIYSRLSNVRAFVGSSGADSYYSFVGDSGLAVEGGFADKRYYSGWHDGVDILGNSDVLLGSSIVSSAYYLLGDVFYCSADVSYEEPFEVVNADNLYCLGVDKTAPDKAAAAEARIRNYFRNTADVSVDVEKLSPAGLADLLNAYYFDANDNYKPVKAAYMTKNGVALYAADSGTAAGDFVASINLPYNCKKLVGTALAAADKQGQLSYMRYDKYTSSGEFEDTIEAKSVDYYPLYKVSLEINGETFERVYLINGVSADELAQLDEEALAYYADEATDVIIQADDGSIPVDTAAVIEELDGDVFTDANPEELGGKDVNVYDVSPYSSANGALADLNGSEMSLMLPLGDDSIAQVYGFDEDGNITEILPVQYYSEVDGVDYAVITVSHFSIYGSSEAVCEHSVKFVELKQASFESSGVEAHYECEVCGRCFNDENATERVRRKSLTIPRATAKLSTTSFVYNGKTKTPAVICSGLTKNVDYTVSYQSGRKQVGSYTVTVNGIGKYTGKTKLSFGIVPAKPAIKSVTVGSKRLTVNASTKPSAKGAKYYQIAYKQKGTSKWKTVNVKTKSKVIKKLKKGKQYYVRIRAYKKVSGKAYYSNWSKTKLSKKVK